ncbi:zinc finger MYM-type protein 4-like [Tautogolabrus adspersus]
MKSNLSSRLPQVKKGRKLQHFSIEPEEENAHRDFSKAVLRKHQKLESQCGPEAWKRWIQWRKTQTHPEVVSSPAVTFKEEILHCSAKELSDGLCGFIKEVKQPDGEPYPPDNLFYLCLSIQQCLFENGRVENIFSDSIYNKFTTEFTKILKGFKPSITASGYIHSHVEEEFLWDCKQLGAYSPIVLINTLLFFCSKYLGFTTVEQHRQLSFGHIVRHTKTNPDNTKSRFLLCYPPKSINEEESDEDGVPAKKRKKNDSITVMMENTENPLRCPVRLYGFYLSKCSESVRRHPGLFYLQPDRHCVPDSLVWFSSSPLDDSTLEAMLVRILAVRQMWGEDEGDLDQQTSVDQTFIPEEEESD